MTSKSPEEKLEYLLKTLATCDEFKPNYDKLKDVMNINTKANAQWQLKAIVESGKQYILESTGASTRVIDKSDGSAAGIKPTTTKPRKRGKKEIEDGDEEERPAKKTRKPKAKIQVLDSEDEGEEE